MGRNGKVTLVATSRGAQRAAHGLAAGALPARLVLASGFLSDASGDPDDVIAILGSPAAPPPTLVVRHRHDECRKTSPECVAPFIAWAGAGHGSSGSTAASARAIPARRRPATASTASTRRSSVSSRVSPRAEARANDGARDGVLQPKSGRLRWR